LRDIAADVGVDVALVHRSFGSKEELFQQAARTAFNDNFQQAMKAPDLGAAMTALFVQSRLEPASGIDPLDIVTHSLSSDRASPILRELVEKDFIRPLALRLESGGEMGAALAIACLAGVALLRDVLGIAALREADAETMRPLIAKLICACLSPAAGPGHL
jgi:AcrR family transcriptional regulator